MNRNTLRKGFTLIELMAVVVILAILAGVALPKFFSYAAQSKLAAVKGGLGGVRAGIANFYADKAINSATSRYPTLVELTGGSVMMEILPDNPYYASPASKASNAVQLTTTVADSAVPRAIGAVNEGWRYYSGGGTGSRAVFWANTDTLTPTEKDF